MKKIGFFFMIVTLCLPSLSHAKKVTCKSFATQAEAQSYFNAKKPGYKKLDRDKNGIACEKNK